MDAHSQPDCSDFHVRVAGRRASIGPDGGGRGGNLPSGEDTFREFLHAGFADPALADQRARADGAATVAYRGSDGGAGAGGPIARESADGRG